MRSVVAFFLFLPLAALAQDGSSQRRFQSIGIVFAPEIGYRTLNYASDHEWVEALRNGSEAWNSGFTAGVKVRPHSKRKWWLETGLLYSNKSFKTKKEDLIWASADVGLPESAQTVFRLKYLSFPVNVHYPLLATERITLSARVGLSGNIFLSAKTKVIIGYAGGREGGHTSVKQVGHTRFTLSGLIGTTASYKISDKFFVSAESYYQRFLNSINADNDAKEYLFSFGIGFGVSYVF